MVQGANIAKVVWGCKPTDKDVHRHDIRWKQVATSAASLPTKSVFLLWYVKIELVLSARFVFGLLTSRFLASVG